MRFHITRTGDTLENIATQFYWLASPHNRRESSPAEFASQLERVIAEIKRTPGNPSLGAGELGPGQRIFLPTINGIDSSVPGENLVPHTRLFVVLGLLFAALCWIVGVVLDPLYESLYTVAHSGADGPFVTFLVQVIASRPITFLNLVHLFVLGELLLFALWFFNLANIAALQTRLVYVVVWLIGTSLILVLVNPLLSYLIPLTTLTLALIDWTDIFVSWTILVAITYVAIGDNSNTYRANIKEHQSIYFSFLLTILFTSLLLNYTGDYINLRIGGLSAHRQLLTAHLDDTALALRRVHNHALNLDKKLQSGMVVADTVTTGTSLATCPLFQRDTTNSVPVAAGVSTVSRAPTNEPALPQTFVSDSGLYPICALLMSALESNDAAVDLYKRAMKAETKLLGQIGRANATVSSSIRFLNTTPPSNTNQVGVSLKWTRVAVEHSRASIRAIRVTLIKLDSALANAQTRPRGETTEKFRAAQGIVTNELLPQIEQARAAVGRAVFDVRGVEHDPRLIFGGTASLLVLFVLFPWFLLLLFFLRKRTTLASGIVTDLIRLAPNHALLNRVLGILDIHTGGEDPEIGMRGTDTEQINRQVELVKAVECLPARPDEPMVVSEKRQGVLAFDVVRRAIADRAFSDLEYVLAITLLSLGFAVGWYFVLFPQTSIGLSLLILENSGIIGFVKYVTDNLTPVTAGFVGAYLWSTYVLLRRYYNGDLYPTAYLAALQRMIIVFILSLMLVVLSKVIYEGLGSLPALASKGPDSPAIFWSALLGLAFCVGIFPEVGFTFLRDVVNRAFNSAFPSFAERAPLSDLDGLNYFIIGRLVEENIENIQGLATAKIEDLIVNTYFPGKRIVDWIDQAILYIHCGKNGEWFQLLRGAGIRTATDLLDAMGAKLDINSAATRLDKADDDCVQLVVEAVRGGQAANHDPSPAPLEGGNPPTSRSLTKEILLEIYDAIWPDPNMGYILCWQRGKIPKK